MSIQPQPPDPKWPRYTNIPFPSYRHVPGKTPHPRKNRSGHSFGRPEPEILFVSPEEWKDSLNYLYAIDLFNFAYWWECHEMLESLWRASGGKGKTEQAQFLQGLIQIAIANLRKFMGKEESAKRMMQRGIRRLKEVREQYMGVDVKTVILQAIDYFEGRRRIPPLIRCEAQHFF